MRKQPNNLIKQIGVAIMSTKMKQVLEEIKELNAQERGLSAHCLISSLDCKHDYSVEEEWAELAEKRFKELQYGVVQGVSWDDIKKEIKGKDAL